MPDAPELIVDHLKEENDSTCKRNAFAALVTMQPPQASTYLSDVLDAVPNADELVQLIDLEFIRKDAGVNVSTTVRPKNLRCVSQEIWLILFRHVTCVSSLTSLKLQPRQWYMKLHRP